MISGASSEFAMNKTGYYFPPKVGFHFLQFHTDFQQTKLSLDIFVPAKRLFMQDNSSRSYGPVFSWDLRHGYTLLLQESWYCHAQVSRQSNSMRPHRPKYAEQLNSKDRQGKPLHSR